MAMNIDDYFDKYSSDTSAGGGNQRLCFLPRVEKKTGRAWYKLQNGGKNYSLLFSNTTDSTFANGSESRANMTAEPWDILLIRVGICNGASEEPTIWKIMLFDGSQTYKVRGNDVFYTDPTELNAKKGDYLCYEITYVGKVVPQQFELAISAVEIENGEAKKGCSFPFPLMIGCDRKVDKKVGFFGDSITQGLGTTTDGYDHWVSNIASSLPENISVWNLGIGYARCSDAASNGGWIERAKRNDVICVAFGTNDLGSAQTTEQIISSLETILSEFKKNGKKTILFTLPPFNHDETREARRKEVNTFIRNGGMKDADVIFDFALALNPIDDGTCINGEHPNPKGCRLASDAFLKTIDLTNI